MRPISKPVQLSRQSRLFLRVLSASSYHVDCHIESLLSSQSSKGATFESLLRHHGLVIASGNSSSIFIASKLISLYASLNKPSESTRVFLSVYPKDAFLWNSVIKAHFSNGDYPKSLEFFLAMRRSYTFPDLFTIPMVVSSCAELLLEDFGRSVHGLALKLGSLDRNSAIGPSFVYMYAKCGCVSDARVMFQEMPVRDVVAWTAIIIALVQNGESEEGLNFLCQMHRAGTSDDSKPNSRTLEGGFQACASLGALVKGQCLHAMVVKTGLYCYQTVQSSVFSMYSKCGNPEEAYNSFCELSGKDQFSWTSAIGSFSRSGLMNDCLRSFWEMQDNEIYPDEIVISCIISGFTNSMLVSEGKSFHGIILRHGYPVDHRVYNSLLSMYCKFGFLSAGENLFGRVDKCNKDAWGVMLKGYCRLQCYRKCIELSRQMRSLGIEFECTSLVSVISSCSQLRATHLGRSIHCFAAKNHMVDQASVNNALIDMYGKFGNLAAAWRLFSEAVGNVITWNTMISLYYQHGRHTKAIALFDKMVSQNVKPSLATLVTVLSACSNLASSVDGEKIHRYIEEEGYKINLPLATALIDMYIKCGKLKKSRQLFDALKERDVISWNVMISGHGMHGDVESAIDLFSEMEKSDVEPNDVTFLSLISSCNHTGLVEQGKRLFNMMQHRGVKPNLKHYASMVDLLARSGSLHEAEELVVSMPFPPDGTMWGNLLSSAMIHGELKLGVRMAKLAIEYDPGNDGYYIMLANMYSALGRWEDAEGAREIMRQKGVGKRAAQSAI